MHVAVQLQQRHGLAHDIESEEADKVIIVWPWKKEERCCHRPGNVHETMGNVVTTLRVLLLVLLVFYNCVLWFIFLK